MKATNFARDLLIWFDANGRHDLPWKAPRDPYRIWVSEIMLQQTRVTTVIPYFTRFMERFPDVSALAAAHEDEVLHLWTGLGYYARARNLLKAARHVMRAHNGRLPESAAALNELPGIGRSTAAAIAAMAGDQREAILDGNVKRVLARWGEVEGWPGHGRVEKRLWEIAEMLTPMERVADYTQAVMDLGASICTPRNPDCEACPVASGCRSRAAGRTDELPTPKPRKTLPERSTRMLVLRDSRGAVLLERRPPSGIWGGPWCFPEMTEDDHSDPQGLQSIEEGAPFTHTFTHFRLHITPVHARLGHSHWQVGDQEQDWFDPRKELAVGLPAPIKSLMQRLGAESAEPTEP